MAKGKIGLRVRVRAAAGLLLTMGAGGMAVADTPQKPVTSAMGRLSISTLPFDPALRISSATYTPSGKVLVSYSDAKTSDRQYVKLAIMDDDGRNMRPIFSQRLPDRPKDNGIRYMVFSDNKRIFLGDFIVECAPSLDACAKSTLHDVDYPKEVASGDHIAHRWSEMIVAQDGRHVSWTTLLSNYSAMVFLGELQKNGDRYSIVNPQIISTLNPFSKDPNHADGVLPGPVRGGEVKQFVHGGTAISLVGAGRRDLPSSVVQHLDTGGRDIITDVPGYTETTIFSPDERLGITMTTRFSPKTDPAILGLLPRPYPDSLNMGLPMLAYTYAVTGVRQDRGGNIGPALIDIAKSKTESGYQGINLGREEDWVFRSPMSWHPDSRRAMWIEGKRGTDITRIRILRLPDYRAGKPVPARATPNAIPYASTDMSQVATFAKASRSTDVKVYGRKSGYIHYRRADGVTEKTYVDYSDVAGQVYSGSERLEANPRGRSTYSAKLTLTGPKPGNMDLKITFGPLGGKLPAGIIFDRDTSGTPLSHGYADYGGQRLTVDSLLP